jgi:hypothetical protein
MLLITPLPLSLVELRFTKDGSVHSRVGRDCRDMRHINLLGCVRVLGVNGWMGGWVQWSGWLVGWLKDGLRFTLDLI